MNILNKVTVKNLKKNKVRTLVTIIGIILSVAMFAAVTTSIVSFQSYLVNVVTHSSGSYEGKAENVNSKDISSLKNDKEFKALTSLENLGYADVGTKNEYKPYLFIGGISKNFTEFVPINITEGKQPETQNEIVLPNHLSSNGGVKYKIGQRINLSIGNRTAGGKILYQNSAYDKSETFKKTKTATYTVVGFYARPDFEKYDAPGYTALTLQDNSIDNYSVFVCADKSKNIYNVMERNIKDTEISYNSDLLRFKGASNEGNYNTVLYNFAAILIVIIMAGSISLIYNAFSISVSERTKQFGLLKSIGATKRQMLKSVIFEALVLCLIGIPLGLLAGVGGIGITLQCIKGSFISLVNTTEKITLGLTISPVAIAIAAAIGIITVLISAYIPAKKAVRKPAIESIRQSGDIKIKSKKIKTSKLTYKLFGFEGMLANKNFKRNKRKYRSTVISLFISILLFMTAGTFSAYLNAGTDSVLSEKTFDISYSINSSSETAEKRISQSLKAYPELKQIDGITKSVSLVMGNPYNSIYAPKNMVTKQYFTSNSEENGKEAFIQPLIVFVEDNIYKDYLTQNKLDEKKYMNAENPVALCGNDFTIYNGEESRYNNITALNEENQILKLKMIKQINGYSYNGRAEDDKSNIYKSQTGKKDIYLSDKDSQVTKTIKIGEFIKTAPFGAESIVGKGFCLLYPNSAMTNFFSETDEINNYSAMLCFVAPNHKNVTDKMSAVLDQKSYPTDGLFDISESVDATQALMLVVNVFTFGFIILISLICVANVFNTISTNISLRRREFAMLKSVGMPNSGFNKMMNYECLFYGLKSLAFGLPVSLIVSLLLFKALQNGIDMPFMFPWQNIIIAIVSVFAVVFTTMLYSMRKIKKDNPIEALKNENI